jgi:hypothetical protein
MSDDKETPPYDGIGSWWCSECEHSHTGRQLGYICIGCPCGFVPDHPLVSEALNLPCTDTLRPEDFVGVDKTEGQPDV